MSEEALTAFCLQQPAPGAAKLNKRWAGSVFPQGVRFVLVLSPGHSRSVGTGFLVPCDKFFSPAWAPKEVFLLLEPPGHLFTVLLVVQPFPAKTLSLPLSPAGQVFSLSIVLEGKAAGSIELERPA